MSIASEINRINGEVSSQSTIIDEISTILDGKAGANSNVKHITQIIANPSNVTRIDFVEPGNWRLTVCVNGEQKAECEINGLSDQTFETDFSFDISQDYLTAYISQNATSPDPTPITYCGFCIKENTMYIKGFA